MGYIQNNLVPGEKIAYVGRIHRFAFIPGLTLLAIGVGSIAVGAASVTSGTAAHAPGPPADNPLLALGGLGVCAAPIVLLISFTCLLQAACAIVATELAVTTRRVVAKVGLLGRQVMELNHVKVESVSVDQGLLGRIFGYGKVTIRGSGGTSTTISTIADPLEFRRQAMIAADASVGSSQRT